MEPFSSNLTRGECGPIPPKHEFRAHAAGMTVKAHTYASQNPRRALNRTSKRNGHEDASAVTWPGPGMATYVHFSPRIYL